MKLQWKKDLGELHWTDRENWRQIVRNCHFRHGNVYNTLKICLDYTIHTHTHTNSYRYRLNGLDMLDTANQ